jgi:hypothetical protein
MRGDVAGRNYKRHIENLRTYNSNEKDYRVSLNLIFS